MVVHYQIKRNEFELSASHMLIESGAKRRQPYQQTASKLSSATVDPVNIL